MSTLFLTGKESFSTHTAKGVTRWSEWNGHFMGRGRGLHRGSGRRSSMSAFRTIGHCPPWLWYVRVGSCWQSWKSLHLPHTNFYIIQPQFFLVISRLSRLQNLPSKINGYRWKTRRFWTNFKVKFFDNPDKSEPRFQYNNLVKMGSQDTKTVWLHYTHMV